MSDKVTLYKLIVYVADLNGYYGFGNEQVECNAENAFYEALSVAKVLKSAEINWRDEIDINQKKSDISDWEKYFEKESEE